MDELEAELTRLLAEPAKRDAAAAGRVGSLVRRRIHAWRSLAILGATATFAAAAAAAIVLWNLAQTALSGFQINRGVDVLMWLPVLVAIAIVGLAACCIAAAVMRSRAVRMS